MTTTDLPHLCAIRAHQTSHWRDWADAEIGFPAACQGSAELIALNGSELVEAITCAIDLRAERCCAAGEADP